MLALCEKLCLRESAARLGPDLCTCNTTYIIPGWNALASHDSHPAHGLCVLVTFFNLALNFARALAWFSGRVTLAIDHTFKVCLRLRMTSLPVSLCLPLSLSLSLSVCLSLSLTTYVCLACNYVCIISTAIVYILSVLLHCVLHLFWQHDTHGHPHICINAMGPDQSAHRSAFGHTNAALPCLACLPRMLCCRSYTRHTMYALTRMGSILYAVTYIGLTLYGQTHIHPYCMVWHASCLSLHTLGTCCMLWQSMGRQCTTLHTLGRCCIARHTLGQFCIRWHTLG